MCIWKILSINQHLWLLANITICLTLLAKHVNGRPQDNLAEMAKDALMAFQQGAEILNNGALISKAHDLELPFGKAFSKTEIGAGQAMIDRDNSESSEEDEDRRRRKRSLNDIMNDIRGEESLLPSLPQHMHDHHIFKRAACHGSTGGGSTGTNTGIDGAGDGIDVVERRRRARMRKAKAAKKRKSNSSKNSTRKTKKSKLVSDVEQTLTRRKRQSEQDDLNASVDKAGQDIAQHAQQFAEKVRSVWDGFINSINQMAQSIKQKFSQSNPTATEDI